ncbi:hypothetical protein C454_00270 [Haloferax gibbonsii ATCC 33959]|uniref:Uncharacterized protein n=1 Tax=Haloferax gibbonsii (strain ATCC 33959 / DSM 4427 / JCM 8863 / NBRC 102184 / NCIMB 2188 / Ma 2.38) TaxID=1227459 RepID=M0HT59_HALGM|nr:hypothetical protein C454_00270 [Haloferax gibbonsii ATCC 33959]
MEVLEHVVRGNEVDPTLDFDGEVVEITFRTADEMSDEVVDFWVTAIVVRAEEVREAPVLCIHIDYEDLVSCACVTRCERRGSRRFADAASLRDGGISEHYKSIQ